MRIRVTSLEKKMIEASAFNAGAPVGSLLLQALARIFHEADFAGSSLLR